MLKTPIVASEGSLELIPGAALPEKTLSNLETFIQYSYLSAMIYIVCVKRRDRAEEGIDFNSQKPLKFGSQLILRILFKDE